MDLQKKKENKERIASLYLLISYNALIQPGFTKPSSCQDNTLCSSLGMFGSQSIIFFCNMACKMLLASWGTGRQ